MAQRRFHLIWNLAKRDVGARYRGSLLGILWSFLTPLFMLAIYTFVFGAVYKSRWPYAIRNGGTQSTAEFALILFAGLIVFQIFSETLSKAPRLVVENRNYVKKVVFPVDILPLVTMGSALFHAAVSLIVLLGFEILILGNVPPTAVLLPIVLLPLIFLVLGLAWFFAALGVYVRDIGEFLGPLISASMFLSPIFFPPELMPGWFKPFHYLNPIALPVEMARDVLLFGRIPSVSAFGFYFLFAVAVMMLGHLFFSKVRQGFADVL